MDRLEIDIKNKCIRHSDSGKILKKLYTNPIKVNGDTIIIYDIHCNEIIIDKESYSLVADIVWRVNSRGYVVGQSLVDGIPKTMYMHRVILGVIDSKSSIIHKDNNQRNCTGDNLVAVDKAVISRGRGLLANNTTGVPGITMNSGKYRARIWASGSVIELGTKDTLHEAEKIRKEAEDRVWETK